MLCRACAIVGCSLTLHALAGVAPADEPTETTTQTPVEPPLAATADVLTDQPAPTLDPDAGAGAWRFTGAHLYWENDGTYADPFDETDHHYTNGAKIELTFDPAFDADTREFLAPSDRWPDAKLAFGVLVAQHIYTASSIELKDPPADDRPYAGWLYTGVYLQRRSGNVHDHLELDVGVVGSWSLGEDAQRFIHAAVSNQVEPQGWSHQLANELAINVRLQRSWRTERAHLFGDGGAGGLEMEGIGRLGADLGNVFIRANSDVTLRLGMHLPDDFGPPRMLDYRDATGTWSPDHTWGLYGYGRMGLRAVAHNIFLDGNTFADSRSTDPERLVGELEVGLRGAFELAGGMLEVGYAWTYSTPEYRAQSTGDTIGAWTLSWVHRF